MRLIQFHAFFAIACLSAPSFLLAQVYQPPTGGWTYLYDGDVAAAGGGFAALDGTWGHDNGSDSWDESDIGSGAPGGVTGGLMDGDTTFVRFQDTGDPRDHGFPDPSNRKYYFGHDITAEGAGETILDDGVTISFRARLSTGDPLDDVYPGGGVVGPWPTIGDGYAIHDGGKSSFSIHQNAGGTISFALANQTDGEAGSVLRMNSLNGNAVSGDVDTGEGTDNVFSTGEATSWQEFWITIQGGGTGTHQVQVFSNGSSIPTMFDVTAGSGNDFAGISYIATGLGSTGQTGAIDVDFFAWRDGVFQPGNSVELGDFNQDGVVNNADFNILSDNLAGHLDGASVGFEQGDIDFDGDVDLDDFGQFKELFPGALGQAQGVPEPATVTLIVCAIAVLSLTRLFQRSGT